MNSFAVKFTLGAALFGLPLATHAQRNPGSFGPSVRPNVTLLTGPYLLSPASPPKSPVEGQEWTFVKTGSTTVSNTPAQGRLLPGSATSAMGNVTFSGVTSVSPGSDPQTKDTRSKYERAKERLEQLDAEHAAVLQRQNTVAPFREQRRNSGVLILRESLPTVTIPADPIRFDARMPDPPRLKMSKPADAEAPVKRD